MKLLNLNGLKLGQSGLTPIIAAFLVEAAIYCLEENGHKSGVRLNIDGDFKEEFQLIWDEGLTEQMKNSWKDKKETTEYGATAIAAILLPKLTGFEILSRAEQGNGVDYHVGNKGDLKIIAHLEISGIWNSSAKNTVNIRINKKLKQIQQTKDKLPVFVMVTEFGKPQSKLIKYE